MVTKIKLRQSVVSALCVCIIILICVFLNGCAPQAAPSAPAEAPSTAAPAPVPTPEPTVDCGIPDLQYETEAYALQTLRSRGVVAVIEYDENDSTLPGLVEAQSVEAGVCVKNGQPVKLTIAKAVPTAAPTPTPKPESQDDDDPDDAQLVPEITAAPVNVVYVDGVAVTPQPTWSADTFEFDFDDPGAGASEPCG